MCPTVTSCAPGQVVSRRAASLAGAGVAVLLNRIGEKKVTVAVDGSVYRFHPFFHDMMVQTIGKLVKPDMEVRYKLLLVIGLLLIRHIIPTRELLEMAAALLLPLLKHAIL